MSKFVINRGIDNEYVLTIKQNGTTLPMVIDGTDTFSARLLKMSDSSFIASIPVTVTDAANGKITLTIDYTLADTLSWEKGDKADYYYAKPLYQIDIHCTTVNNGDFTATIEKVYVE